MTPWLTCSARLRPWAAAAVLPMLLAACGRSADPPTPPTPPTPATTATTSTVAPVATAPPTATAATSAASAWQATATTSPVAPAPPAAAGGVAWLHASTSAEVDAAFAQARRDAKPVFVYWGASWCPPCNQVKATLFNRQDFIARSRSFLPIYVDGDSPGAQKLGARFRVSGYPTMVLFTPSGTELTRLPGEVDASRYQSVLTLAMSASARPAAEVLADALAGGKALTPDDWRLLAFYSWETDEQRLVPKGGLTPLLRQLATACPTTLTETSQRLRLQALASAGSDPGKATTPDVAALPGLQQLLGDESAARAQLDLIANSAVDILHGATAAGSPERQALRQALDTALRRMETDAQLSRADRMSALASRVELARADDAVPPAAASGPAAAGRAASAVKKAPPRLPDALLADVRDTTARADREITDGYERQAVVTSAADVLDRAGLGAESDALLRANLTKSHSPYYLMSALARHARDRGDTGDALHWYRAAFERSEGPATRLQWGASYLGALVDLSPGDSRSIEATSAQLLREAAGLPDAFDGRSGRSLQRIGARLVAWGHVRGDRQAVLARLQAQLDGVCAALPAGDATRADCDRMFRPAPAPKA